MVKSTHVATYYSMLTKFEDHILMGSHTLLDFPIMNIP